MFSGSFYLFRSKFNWLLFGFLIVLTSACSKREPIAIIEDYEEVFTSNKSIMFAYSRFPENDTLYIAYKTFFEDGTKCVIENTFTKDNKIATRTFKVTEAGKELVEHLYYLYNGPLESDYKVIRGEIMNHEQKNDDGPYKGGEYSFKFRITSTSMSSIKVREKFAVDTLVRWNGEDIPTLKFATSTKLRTFFPYFPLVGTTTEYSGCVYYTKGIGITKVKDESEDGLLEYNLISVEKGEGMEITDLSQ